MFTSAVHILYQDDDFVAVDKPAGIMVHHNPKFGRQNAYLLQMVRDLIGKRLYPVHRLDRPTSGVLLFALSPEMARAFAESAGRKAVEKTYLAVIRGHAEEAALIDYPLTKDAYGKKKDQVVQPARTAYRRLATVEFPIAVGRFPVSRYSLVTVHPLTGRMHQIRRHFHHISHPVIGDTVYGDGRHNRFFRTHFNCYRLLLVSVELSFLHPRSHHPLKVVAPLGPLFREVIHKLGWENSLPRKWLS